MQEGKKDIVSKILIVDDNKLNLVIAKNVLKATYDVATVTGGEEAIAYFEDDTCDLILLDIIMPVMDGFAVIEKLKESEKARDIPVIFLTADNDAATESRCFTCGAIDFIVKPFVAEVMLSRIGRALELEQLRKNLADKLEKKTREVSDMKSKSHKDSLTGLWNRSYTEEAVNELLEEDSSGALLMIDMDNFKAINDNYGHIAGDRVLVMFADTMREFCTEEDILCRIGGDEFVAFVRSAKTKAELSNLAGDILASLCRKLQESKFDTNTSVSIGIAQHSADGETDTNGQKRVMRRIPCNSKKPQGLRDQPLLQPLHLRIRLPGANQQTVNTTVLFQRRHDLPQQRQWVPEKGSIVHSVHQRKGLFHRFPNNFIHQSLDIGIVGIEGGTVDICPLNDISHRNLFQCLFFQQFQKCRPDQRPGSHCAAVFLLLHLCRLPKPDNLHHTVGFPTFYL